MAEGNELPNDSFGGAKKKKKKTFSTRPEVDEEIDDEEGGKTMGREFGGLESHREEPPSASNCSSVRMLAAGS